MDHQAEDPDVIRAINDIRVVLIEVKIRPDDADKYAKALVHAGCDHVESLRRKSRILCSEVERPNTNIECALRRCHA